MDGFTFGKQGGTIYINVPNSGMNNIEITNKDGNIQLSEISAEHIVVDNHSGDEKSIMFRLILESFHPRMGR